MPGHISVPKKNPHIVLANQKHRFEKWKRKYLENAYPLGIEDVFGNSPENSTKKLSEEEIKDKLKGTFFE